MSKPQRKEDHKKRTMVKGEGETELVGFVWRHTGLAFLLRIEREKEELDEISEGNKYELIETTRTHTTRGRRRDEITQRRRDVAHKESVADET